MDILHFLKIHSNHLVQFSLIKKYIFAEMLHPGQFKIKSESSYVQHSLL